MKAIRFRAVLIGLGLLATACILAGCEASSANSPITVTPQSVVLYYGQSQQFIATGGYDYTWTLSDNSSGTLNPRTGPSVIYTYTSSSTSGQVQTITVTSTIQGSAGSATNSASYTVSTSAYITQM